MSVTIKKMKDGLPAVLQNRDELPGGHQFVESWDRLAGTVTVTVVDPEKDGRLVVLKFTESQYASLVVGIRKLKP